MYDSIRKIKLIVDFSTNLKLAGSGLGVFLFDRDSILQYYGENCRQRPPVKPAAMRATTTAVNRHRLTALNVDFTG